MSNSAKRFSSLIQDLQYMFMTKRTKSVAACCSCLIRVLALWERCSLLPTS